MMQLVLMVNIPGVNISPMGMEPRGVSMSPSPSTGVHRQAVTPEKPRGRVVDCMSTNACTGKEGLGGMGVFGGGTGVSLGIIRGG